MPQLKIKTFPSPVLRRKASKVIKVTDAEAGIISSMADTMYMNNGVGLAAVQVGIDKQIAVIDIGTGLRVFINPVILKKEGRLSEEEGCLSVPGVVVRVKRARRVTVSFMDEKGAVCKICADGLLSRAIQHEMDHLSGKLIIDYLGPVKRFLAVRKKSLTKPG
jgi:peptide deformylase